MTKVRVWDIPGYPGYAISETGDIFKLPYKCKRGRDNPLRQLKINMSMEYPSVEIWQGDVRRTKSVHRLLAETFIPNPDEHPQINHINGDKFDYRLDNLEWVSASDNVIHSYRTGLASNKGEKHPAAKFKDSDIPVILEMRRSGKTLKEIAEIYNVCRSTIGKITSGVHYAQSAGI